MKGVDFSIMAHVSDIVIIGGGVMGCATAHYLAESGVKDVTLLERDTLASGSTGRSMTILRMHYSNPITTEMAWWSRGVIAGFEDAVGSASGFVENGWVMLPGAGNESAVLLNVEMAQSLGVATETLSVDEARSRWDYMSFGNSECVVYESMSGYADSHLVTTGFADSARRDGTQIKLGESVSGFKTAGDRIEAVETESGDVHHADRFVLTAGPWNSDLLGMLGVELPLHTVRHQVIRLRHQKSFAESADPHHPTIAHIPTALSARPDVPGTTLIGYREDVADRDSYNHGVDADVAAEAISALASIVPAYADAGWDGGWSGLFTVTPDWNPVIDAVPNWDNVVVGAGFSGHGFKMSPAIGKSLAELTINVETTFDLHPLRFTRYEEGDLLQSAYGGNVFA